MLNFKVNRKRFNYFIANNYIVIINIKCPKKF